MSENKNTIITDGQNLAERAEELKNSGVTDVTVVVNTFNYTRYKQSNDGKSLEPVIEGINSAVGKGLGIRLNVGIKEGFNDDEIMDFVQLTFQHDYEILFIGSDSFPAEEIRNKLPGFREAASQEQDVITGKYPGAVGKICFEK